MGVNTLSINNTALQNVYVDTSLSFNKPARNVEMINIPGRNGALVLDNGTFENLVIPYPCYIKGNFDSVFNSLVNTLGSYKGYQRITCSNDATHFRLGRVIIPQSPTVKRLNDKGFFDLSFDCKPQRFLLTGESTTDLTASGTITNPTNFDALPLLRVYGNGKITVNGVEITLANNTGYTDIDCEMQDCFYGSTNRNNNVSFSGNDFPKLKPGSNTITFGTGITRCIITPRWWEL